MSTDSKHPEIPPGPADAALPRRALAQLALSQQARDLAERASSLVPTDSAPGDDTENVAIAARLVDDARELLARAVIEARERGVSWQALGEEHGGITRQSVQERYAESVADWEDVLNQPWQPSGMVAASRLPGGLEEPDATAARLDAWAQAHVGTERWSRQRAEQQEVGLVSTGLEAHSGLTRSLTAQRYDRHLRAREQAGEEVGAAEWERLAELKTRARAATATEQAERVEQYPAD